MWTTHACPCLCTLVVFYLQKQTIIFRIWFYRNIFYFSWILLIIFQCPTQMILSKCWLNVGGGNTLVPPVCVQVLVHVLSPLLSYRRIELPINPFKHCAFSNIHEFAHSRFPWQKCPSPICISAKFLTPHYTHFYYFIHHQTHPVSVYMFALPTELWDVWRQVRCPSQPSQ